MEYRELFSIEIMQWKLISNLRDVHHLNAESFDDGEIYQWSLYYLWKKLNNVNVTLSCFPSGIFYILYLPGSVTFVQCLK